MTGTVDESGRALLVIQVRSNDPGLVSSLTVWIDTAFTGELVMPRAAIKSLGLERSAGVLAVLADGNTVELEAYRCQVNWLGQWRAVEAIENNGQLPLLGIELLRDSRLVIDYRTRTINME